MVENYPTEYFVERIANLAYANGVFRVTFAQNVEGDEPKPTVRLIIPANQLSPILKGMANAAQNIGEQFQARVGDQAELDQTPKRRAPKQQAPKRQAPRQQAPKRQAPKQQAPKQRAPKRRRDQLERSMQLLHPSPMCPSRRGMFSPSCSPSLAFF